ncbi:MAG TPA: LysR family transcriptional regulator [Bryobacteraceae bacterium]|nr:LysR family transcriptional regulator [Bryobacteraceae bacterium]
MDIRQLELFLAVIEQSSVTKAAERMNLSAGAVSLQLRNLARSLRTELFVRSGKRLLPTPAALRLAEQARQLMRMVQQIEREFESAPDGDTRPFYFACGATALIYKLRRPFRQLRKQFPHIAMQVTVAPTEEMVAGVMDRRFDLALVTLPFPTGDLGVTPLFEEELVILRPSAKSLHGWRVGAIEPAEMATAPFLLYPKRSNMRAIIDQFFAGIGIQPRVTMEADDTEVIKGLVESGFGYSMLPEFALHTGAKFFQVFRVPGHRVTRGQALVYAKSENPRALTLAVVKFLRAALGGASSATESPEA